MGLHFLGVFTLDACSIGKSGERGKAGRPLGRLCDGLAFAFGWTPCIGPILAAILAVASSEATVVAWRGLLAVYSLGLGVPFMLAALAMEPFILFLKRFQGSHFGKVEKIVGALLVVTGVMFLTGASRMSVSGCCRHFPGLANLG